MDFLKKLVSPRGWQVKVKAALEEQGLEGALETFRVHLEAQRGCILLEKPGRPPEMIHCGAQELAEEFPFSRTVVDQVLDEGKGLFSFDSSQDDRVSQSESLVGAPRSFACVLIPAGEQSFGVVYIDNPISKGVFSDETMKDIEEFAAMLGTAAR